MVALSAPAVLVPHAQQGTSALRHLREARGWSQVELGSRAGVHPLTILRIEKARAPRGIKFDTLRKLAEVLDVKPHELLGTPSPDDELVARPTTVPALPPSEVLFLADLAAVIRCSTSTVRRTLAERPWDLPRQLASVDKRYRWSRHTVERWLHGDPDAAGPRRVSRR